MTRPLGKSPARFKIRNSQLDLNQVSLIDVCAEDDSLLSGKGISSPQGSSGPPTPCPRPGPSPFKVSTIRTLACIQEDQSECEESQGIYEGESQDIFPSLSTEELVVKKKKKKSGFNLRKSLAWNNAFFTEEGVLDPEELSLVNRTFKKPLEEPKLPSNKKPAFASKILNTSAISKINFSPVRFQKPPSCGETRHHSTAPPAQGSPLSSIGNASKRTDQQNKGSALISKQASGLPFSRTKEDTTKHAKSILSTRTEFQGLKPSPQKKHIEENPRITSGHALPARSSSKPPLKQPKQTQSISSTLSSASRMMKDRLGMVFAGRNVGSPKTGTKATAEDDTVVSSHRIPEYSDSAKLGRCYSHSSYERFGRSTAATSIEPTRSAVSNVNTALESRASNLHGTFVSKGVPSTYTGFSSSFRRSKEQAPGPLSSHPQGVSNYTRLPQQTALEATKSNTRETGASESLLPRAKPSGLRMPSPKLGFFDKARTTHSANVAVLRERTNGLGYDGGNLQSVRYVGAAQLPSDVSRQSSSNSYGVLPQAIKTASSQITRSVPSASSYGSPSIAPSSLLMTQESPSLSTNILGSHVSDAGTILQVKKNVQNVIPSVKKMVNKLTLSPLQNTEQENLPSHPQAEGASQHSSPRNVKAFSNRDIGGSCSSESQEEWPQVKSGAVQHSPTHKEPPKYGPWSPVRRNAPELGPFDCTKYTNNTGIAH